MPAISKTFTLTFNFLLFTFYFLSINFYFSLLLLDFHFHFSQTEDKELAWWQKANWKPCLPFLKLSLWPLNFYFLPTKFLIFTFTFRLSLPLFTDRRQRVGWLQKPNWKHCQPSLKLYFHFSSPPRRMKTAILLHFYKQ